MKISRRQFLISGGMLFIANRFPEAWAKLPPVTLPIPPLLDGTKGIPVDLKIREGSWSFKSGVKTPTLGINQDYLGPTIRTRKNTELNLHYQNTLTEGVAMHGHGLHVPGIVDGGPQLEIASGESWKPNISIVQQAATCWYHSHTHGKSGEQVYRGLAGMIIIDDENSDTLDLPKQYGVDDLPVIIQDRTFNAEGKLVYSLEDAGDDGWFGETVVINGAIAPIAKVPAGKVRLRLLNGANGRFYIIKFTDDRPFLKVASDGGFLNAPVEMTEMEMAPGDRCEIIVDMENSDSVGLLTMFEDEVDIEGIFANVMSWFKEPTGTVINPSLTLVVDKTLPAQTKAVPAKLNNIVRPKPEDIVRTRDFILSMEAGENSGHSDHAHHSMSINGAAMDMKVINERVKKGEWERWRVKSDQGFHPFHVHGCSFLVETMEGEKPPLDQQGWKDLVLADEDAWSSILVRFDYEATDEHPYMYHCHILEHEDMGMMGQFTVS